MQSYKTLALCTQSFLQLWKISHAFHKVSISPLGCSTLDRDLIYCSLPFSWHQAATFRGERWKPARIARNCSSCNSHLRLSPKASQSPQTPALNRWTLQPGTKAFYSFSLAYFQLFGKIRFYPFKCYLNCYEQLERCFTFLVLPLKGGCWQRWINASCLLIQVTNSTFQPCSLLEPF